MNETKTIDDSECVDWIYALMDGQEWNADTLDAIAEAVLATGREPFASPDATA